MLRMPNFLKTSLAVALMSLVVVGCSEQSSTSNSQQNAASTDALNSQQQAVVDRITEAYLSIQSQLASDSIDQVPAQLQAIRDSAQSLQDQAGQADNSKLKTQGSAIAKAADFQAKDVKQARNKLVDLSDSVIKLVQAHPPSDAAASELYLAECPMVDNGLWLQPQQQVTNPYMGSRMLQCGSIQQTIKDSDEAGDGASS